MQVLCISPTSRTRCSSVDAGCSPPRPAPPGSPVPTGAAGTLQGSSPGRRAACSAPRQLLGSHKEPQHPTPCPASSLLVLPLQLAAHLRASTASISGKSLEPHRLLQERGDRAAVSACLKTERQPRPPGRAVSRKQANKSPLLVYTLLQPRRHS